MLTKPRAIWTPDQHNVFMDLCVQQTLSGSKPGSHFNRDGWKNILSMFNRKTGASYDRLQLKHHWDFICKQWKIWNDLIGCSYMKWDPETKAFGASDEDWDNYLKVNPKARQYQLGPPPDIKKLEFIFDGKSLDAGDDEIQVFGKRPRMHHDDESDSESEDDEQSTACIKRKGYWSATLHELFIDLCVRETSKGNRPGTHFTKEGWKNILETFNKYSGLGYTRLQLKHHWDSTKKQWKIWCKLISTSSMKWDPVTQTFGATDEEWQSYISANSRAGKFRQKQIPLADKLDIIFDGSTNTGETDSLSQRRKLDNLFTLASLHVDGEQMSCSPLHMIKPATGSPNGETTCHPVRKKQNGNSLSNVLADESVIAFHQCDAGDSRSNITIQKSPTSVDPLAPGKLDYSIGDCIEFLDQMEEIEQGSDFYLFALDIFLKKEYREIFLQLKKPSLRIAWLQRLQSVGSSSS